ncbi:unnamed protein product [Rotaria socialis]|uniref:Uncharacterized protein n=1 Tax=Rotaria socialis TaxID=392032 RepID=A0A821ILC6_9BILA|nr:unnamed protein product [Rotaria socialis]
MPIPLPTNVFELQDEAFSQVVKEQCGLTMVDILRYLEVNSVDSLLGINDLFAFFLYDSPDLLPIKNKVGITLTNGSFIVKEGLSFQANHLIQTLQALQQRNSSKSNELTISSVLLERHPIIRLITRFFDNFSSQLNDSSVKFKHTVVETIISNHDRAKSRYCYNDSMREFASCLFILGGRNVYGFIRLNISGLLPSLPIIQSSLDSITNRINEGDFRYDLMCDYLSLQKTNFIFASEDCTGVIPQIIYNVPSNTFIDFVPHLEDGLPKINTFSTESFSKFENWFGTLNKSHLLNLHMVQPINLDLKSCAPFILSAYGTDNHFTTLDILMRWMTIINQCFFADMPNQQFHLRDNAFYVGIPKSWDWFFMRNHQRIVFFQDSIHLCSKLRNRLLSSKAKMLFGDKLISIDHILQLIETSSKRNHNLVKSDVLPKDRQNFVSCEKISNEIVLNELTSIPASEATKIYLEIIRNIRYAFINKDTNYIDRIHYAWENVFLIRFWYTWLSTKTKSELNSTLAELFSSQAHKKKNTKQQYFITLPAMFSIEINNHTLVYLALLVIQHKLPTVCLHVPIVDSQTCESTFRSCRAMSGPFSSIVNFTVHQFLQRVKKLSFLNSIKCQAGDSNASDSNKKIVTSSQTV